MSEDLGFDPSLKKKKKSKSKTEDSPAPVDSATENVDELFSGLKKKKKKSKSVETESTGDASNEPTITDALEGLSLKKKKKKSSSSKNTEADDFDKQLEQAGINAQESLNTSTNQSSETNEIISSSSNNAPNSSSSPSQSSSSIPSSSPLAYPNLLSRFFSILKEKNPELAGGQQSKLKIPPPEVAREGNKKTMFANVQTIATVLQRNPEHLIQYLFAELGTSGSIDGEKRLIIKGRFQAKNIESVLRRYIQEYVICKTCKSMNTELKRESTNRLHFIVCKACGSTKSVSSIKTGFQAHVGRRKKV
ncbi:hypothetical protein CANARDRAFT_8819 [[Candida] arabinofermentans NRRL YB-2248]|uniref:Translation initiation factor IF2/IF5 domain-containing protein n=1 Tax=[Candida] arabinofermentans NRRL YB-2248 TaxID=983967 RepID=A0A1E4SXB0_9ASCO|nr:hypothetical protein CANARDRAFT_8819 [[Candida] arabinofermentans NRRL YB-2248]